MKNCWLQDPKNLFATLLRSVILSIWNLKLPINDDQNLNVSSMLLKANFIFCENETKYAGPNVQLWNEFVHKNVYEWSIEENLQQEHIKVLILSTFAIAWKRAKWIYRLTIEVIKKADHIT